jgi:hypothetical protein
LLKALPKLSSIVLVSKIIRSTHPLVEDTVIRNCKINFVLSVFPAPDSPDMITDWFFWVLLRFWNVALEVAKIWGSGLECLLMCA